MAELGDHGPREFPYRDMRPGAHAWIALLVGVAYFLAATLSRALDWPEALTPYPGPATAIILAALLVNQPQRWWLLILAVLPAHLLVRLPEDPVSITVLTYLTNCAAALVGAIALMRFSPQPVRFRHLRSAVVLVLVSATLVPLAFNLITSVAATFHSAEDRLWEVNVLRTAACTLSVVLVVPLLVEISRAPREVVGHWFRHAPEAIAMLLLLAIVAMEVFMQPRLREPFRSIVAVCAPWPLLLWAAVRFEVTGACAALLLLTFLAALGISGGAGTFGDLSPAAAPITLIGYLLVVAIPLVPLAALLSQHRDESFAQQRQLTHLGRVAVLGELSGSFAHELGQPLTSILGNAEAALQMLERKPQQTQSVQECLRDIIDDDLRAAEMIQRLRGLLRRGEVHLEQVDLNGLIREALQLLQTEVKKRNVLVLTQLHESLRAVEADRIQIQQVLVNLVLNACEAMDDVVDRQRTLRIATRNDETRNEVEVAIADSGTGIPTEDLDRIFEPFVSSKPQGLGLGLSICRAIATAHGGRLWAESSGMQGAVFHLVLPGVPQWSVLPSVPKVH